jgi:hypothetical protein
MNKNGGGSNTNLNGLYFEEKTNLINVFKKHELIEIINNYVFLNKEEIGFYTEKHNFYKSFLEPFGVNYKNILSKKLLPDGVFVNTKNKTIYIIEKKYQQSPGSVDEKIQTGPYKKRIFSKLCENTGYFVKYYYLLNEWFNKSEYDDVKDYLIDSGCGVYINEIPLQDIGICGLNIK